MKQELGDVIEKAVYDLFGFSEEIELTRPDESFGDFASNVALKIAKRVGDNPRVVAQKIVDKLKLSSKIKLCQLAGPGFINITLSDNYLVENLDRAITHRLTGKKVLIEYSDTNPFKPLHAGHLYTTLVGDILARLLENVGAEVVRLNYGGDVGLHVGKSMWAITKYLEGEYPEKLSAINPIDRPSWLGDRYVEGNEAYETSIAAKSAIIETNKRVYEIHRSHDTDSVFAQIYWKTRQWSYDYFADLYRELKVIDFDRFIPESEVTELGIATVNKELSKGVFKKSNGAVVYDGERVGLHTRVFINSEGLPTYETKDVGLSLTKWQDYKFDESIIITANEQTQYMQVVISAISQFAPEPAKRTKHITHGVVKLKGGVKMSSRKGNVVMALDILNSAKLAGDKMEHKQSEDTILAAVKYSFAKVRIGGDILYDPEESVALEGNSGPYLQYAYARGRSILRKAGFGLEANSDIDISVIDFDSAERKLLVKISQFNEIVELATDELRPHHICTYLYELSQVFNRFYEDNRVIGSDERELLRLWLVDKYTSILSRGLSLIGISAPESM